MRRECREPFPRHWLQRKQLVCDPGMHHETCVTHVPWCMSGSRGKRSRHSRRMRKPQSYVSNKGPIVNVSYKYVRNYTSQGWFCRWIFFENGSLNLFLWESRLLCLHSQILYSSGVSCFVTGCACGVCARGLTSCFHVRLYIFGKSIFNKMVCKFVKWKHFPFII